MIPLVVLVMLWNGKFERIIFSFIPVFSMVYACVVAPVSMEVVYNLVVGDDTLIVLFILCILLSSLPSCHSFFFCFGFIVVVAPPILLVKVASFLCPSFGYLQLQLVCLRLRPIPCDQQYEIGKPSLSYP